MPRKKEAAHAAPARPQLDGRVEIADAGIVLENGITDTLESNFMPYAMSIIVSRALPEIDGFKPAHRKLLYTMYQMGLLHGPRTKSANIVGQTMRLNPHGDAAIYETMVRLARGNESLLAPFVDSKGNFGKAYSRDMACAAPRYTEARLEPLAAELFGDIDKDTVDFVDNYDATTTEPRLLPVSFPAILANTTLGLAVGMTSNICSFNLAELCEATVALIHDAHCDLMACLPAPDFVGGGYILYDEGELRSLYDTGRGSIRVRARYHFDKAQNIVEVNAIPPTTTVEAVMDKIGELAKAGRLPEIRDMRDETDLNGLKLALDLKKGADPDRAMARLFRLTPLEDTFSCNLNLLISGTPQVLGVRDILLEWIAFRIECVRRRVWFDRSTAQDRLHLLQGLQAILLDIDKAVRIVRDTQQEDEVVPNLMIGFGIDHKQAEYVAEIRLRHLNREYILKRTQEISALKEQIAGLEELLHSDKKLREVIVQELRRVAKTYGIPRRCEILYDTPDAPEEPAPVEAEAPVHLFFTEGGYCKRIAPQSLRMSGEQKLREGDALRCQLEATTRAELLFFTDRRQVYKCRVSDLAPCKASELGEYIPAKLAFEEGERPLYMALTTDYSGYMLFVYASGKAARVPLASYATKLNRKKLLNAYSDKEPLVWLGQLEGECEMAIRTSGGRLLLFSTAQLAPKAARDAAGVGVITLKKGQHIEKVCAAAALELANPHRYRVRTLPAAGALLRAEDLTEQTTLEG